MAPKNELADKIRLWREHPAQMVRDLFNVEPDAWQYDALESFPHTRRMAMKACAGPGKTAVLSWLGWNFMLTRPHPIIGCTSISESNLSSGLWTEFARWQTKSPLLTKMFTKTGKYIYSNEHPETWRIEKRTWARDAEEKEQGNALAGLHADYVMWLLDETGDYPESLMPVCEGIFNGSPKEAHIIQAGNPTRLGGPLYRACSVARDIWKVIEITADPDDPNRTPRVSIETANEQIKQYGRDNPWVLVRIFGQFPPSNFNALIGPDEIRAAQARVIRDLGSNPRILGVDVARFGDDQSVIVKREGQQVFNLIKKRNIDSVQGAGLVARVINDWKADATFIDDTGGYGSGWLDQLRTLGHSPIGVGYAREAHDKDRYFNKRAEMYFDAVEWIRNGGALPPNTDELLAAMTQTTYAFKGDRLILEPKESIKAKLGYSPDEADAFVMTFAEQVAFRRNPEERGKHTSDYDPFADRKSQDPYNPYGEN